MGVVRPPPPPFYPWQLPYLCLLLREGREVLLDRLAVAAADACAHGAWARAGADGGGGSAEGAGVPAGKHP